MRRRTFFSLLWLTLAATFGLLAVRPVFDGGEVDTVYGVSAVVYSGIAGLYRVYPAAVAEPDEPVPRRWFEITGVVGAALVGAALLLFVALG